MTDRDTIAGTAPPGILARLRAAVARPTAVVPAVRTADVAPTPRTGGRGGWLVPASFALCVLLPGLVVSGYYLFVAADQYVATARFTVRDVQIPTLLQRTEAEPMLGGGLGASAPSQFNHVVASYVRSGAAIQNLRETIDVDAMFRRPEADFWARLEADPSAEARLEYWTDHVSAVVDGLSGIVTLHVRTFRPEDSLALAEALLGRAEALVNRLSEAQKRDALALALADAASAEQRLRDSIRQMADLRNAERLIDPGLQASEDLRLLTSLLSQRIEIEGELRALAGVVNAETAQVRALQTRLTALESEIAAIRSSLADAESAGPTMASTLARFETLATERRFAERFYEIAQRRLIEADVDLARQTIYFGLYDPPRLPEEALYPRRIAYSILGFVFPFVFWAIGTLVTASVHDHRMAG